MEDYSGKIRVFLSVAKPSPVIGREPGRGHRAWRGSVLEKQRHLLDLLSVTYL